VRLTTRTLAALALIMTVVGARTGSTDAAEPRLDWFRAAAHLETPIMPVDSLRWVQAVYAGGNVLLLHDDHTGYPAAELFDGQSGAFIVPYFSYDYIDARLGPLATVDDDFLIAQPKYNQRALVSRHRGSDLEYVVHYVEPTDGAPGFGTALLGHLGRVFVADSGDHVVYVFDANDGRLLVTLRPPRHDDAVFGVPLVAFGDSVLVGGAGAVYRFDVGTGRLRATFTDPTPPGGHFGSAITPLGDEILIGGENEAAVYLFDARGRLQHRFRDPDGLDVTFGRTVAVHGKDVVIGGGLLFSPGARVHVFDGARRRLRHTIANPDGHPEFGGCLGLRGVQFALDGLLAISDPCWGDASLIGIIQLFDLSTGQHVGRIQGPGDVGNAFHAVASYGTTILGLGNGIDEDDFAIAFRPCADGVLTHLEECDDANVVNGDGCDMNCTVTRCGNLIRSGDEECDDGNTAAGDGCSATCRREPLIACPAVPRDGCISTALADDSRLAVRASSSGEDARLEWEWRGVGSTEVADFGNPRDAESYSFCLYAGNALLSSQHVASGGTCGGGASCWTASPRGFRHRNRQATGGAVSEIVLSASAGGRGRISVTTRGGQLAWGAPSASVHVQLASSSGRCWQSLFRGEDIQRHASKLTAVAKDR